MTIRPAILKNAAFLAEVSQIAGVALTQTQVSQILHCYRRHESSRLISSKTMIQMLSYLAAHPEANTSHKLAKELDKAQCSISNTITRAQIEGYIHTSCLNTGVNVNARTIKLTAKGIAFASANQLWSIHITGMDEYRAQPSQEIAEHEAKRFNAWVAKQPKTENTPECIAIVQLWPFTAQSHADELASNPS